jgi:ankyrin repeat protein
MMQDLKPSSYRFEPTVPLKALFKAFRGLLLSTLVRKLSLIMSQSEQSQEYRAIMDVLAFGDEAQFAELEQQVHGFPHDVDHFLGRHWITNAVAAGSYGAIAWMLSRQVDLTFLDEEGYTILQTALERQTSDKYKIIELLLKHGAPINAQGINDWTPAHMASAREDIEALKQLIQFGADLSIRTRIDDYATPLEEAKLLKMTKSVEFLENLR